MGDKNLSPQSVEQQIKDAIQAFENNIRPIFVVYGDVPYFPELISEFRTHVQENECNFYITLDMEIANRETLADTCVEIFQQLLHGYRYIEPILSSEQEAQIPKVWKRLEQVKQRIADAKPEHKFAELVRFAEIELYPFLKNFCKKSAFCIELNRFEHVMNHSVGIGNFLLERLLLSETESSLRFVIFAKHATEPRLYPGSNQEFVRETITFYKLQETETSSDMSKQALSQIVSDEFDVFLCHNSIDKPAIKDIARRLKKEGIRPWLDEWELRPGLMWQIELDKQIEHIQSAAVFVGQGGLGPWQDQEIYAVLRQFVKRGCPVIPVILPDCEQVPKLPPFLEGMMWVDFRKDDPDPFDVLIWSITGLKPEKWFEGITIAKEWKNENR
ncbi:GUN4 domain protein [Candidatus Vecturithrix granuli]|uniref:GUN4 domain protein n=1 Tax=Vecturithrix granuli TaxID=1499967 RepID=A0A081C4X9_VECG1|nr:GUN4 domain protein [Candidatus Vecturithrix granuli]